MGADGGYRYIHKSDLRRGLSEKDIDLFVKFTAHSLFRDTWKEDNDPREYEATLKGQPNIDWLRYPDGTDIDGQLGDYWADDVYTNPPEEVWYYREWLEENLWKHRPTHFWWTDPRAWYVWGHSNVKDEQGWFKPLVTLPNPEELEELVRITEWIEAKHPVSYFETWT